MAINYKRYRVRVQLECGHIRTVRIEPPNRVPEEYQPCAACGYRVAIYAVECREWRSKCERCTYTRWAGQSEAEALRIQTAHFVSKAHRSNVRYYINPATFEVLKKFAKYAQRNFRFRIDDERPIKKVPFPRRLDTTPDEPEF